MTTDGAARMPTARIPAARVATDSAARIAQACTLPTAERPVRVSEFDALFTTALREQRRPSPTRLRMRLATAAEALARDLTDRESACCSFFHFAFDRTIDALWLDIEVPTGYEPVLDALAERARARTSGAASRRRNGR